MDTMYCRNCGTKQTEKTLFCSHCDMLLLIEKNYCSGCGEPTKPEQIECTKCGESFDPRKRMQKTIKEFMKTTTLLTSCMLLSLALFSQFTGGGKGGYSSNKSSCTAINKIPSSLKVKKDTTAENETDYNTVLPATETSIISISPNPAEKEIKLLFYTNEETKINIYLYNALGQVIGIANNINTAKENNHLTIDIGSYASGNYILEIQTESGYKEQKQFIIR